MSSVIQKIKRRIQAQETPLEIKAQRPTRKLLSSQFNLFSSFHSGNGSNLSSLPASPKMGYIILLHRGITPPKGNRKVQIWWHRT